MKVVLDAGVVFSGAGWRGEAYRCLLAMAQRRVTAYATEMTLNELKPQRLSVPEALSRHWERWRLAGPRPGAESPTTPAGRQRSQSKNSVKLA